MLYKMSKTSVHLLESGNIMYKTFNETKITRFNIKEVTNLKILSYSFPIRYLFGESKYRLIIESDRDAILIPFESEKEIRKNYDMFVNILSDN
jgi:hypothetical protein